MTRSVPSDETAKTAVAQELHEELSHDLYDDLFDDNGDTIGPRQFCVNAGLATSPGDEIVQALTILTPTQLAAILKNRTFIEQAKGMLMCVYGTDADGAQELLAWRARAADVEVSQLAVALSAHLLHVSRVDHANLRTACDEFLLGSAADGIH